MPVTLKFQSTGSIPGSGDPVRMNGPSLTIGRGAENDLALPDPDRTLSKRHCVIEDHNGNVVVVDISTNGTFLNYGKLALGATPTPLNDGDILSLGPYEILVSIAQEGAADPGLADPLAEGPISHGFAANAPSASELLDAPGDGGDFLDDLLSGREGPVGPSGVVREEVGDDGLLPPIGHDGDDLLGPIEDPYEGQGASTAMHAPSAQDHFHTPSASPVGQAIPDDWDDDLLAPQTPIDPNDPFARPMEPAAQPTAPATTIPDDFDLDDPDPAPAPIPQESPEPVATEAEPPAEPEQPVAPEPPAALEAAEAPAESEPEQAPAVTRAEPASGDAAARAFLKSLGAEDLAISDAELTGTMSKMGHVLRIMVEGMREILMTRTSIKSEFRIEQTMIQAGGNNPLKFSISPEQAVEALVKPSAKGYLDATDAADQALNDIKAHEVAMVSGMESALKGVLAKLDPAVLEEKISVGGGFSSMLKSKKARYWEIYESMYAEISDQAENDFQELFAREFAKAYKDQLDKLK